MPHRSTRRATLQGLPVGHQQLYHQVEQELEIRHYSPKTRKNYLFHIRQFLYWLQGAALPQATEPLKRYLLFLVEQKKVSNATLHNAHSALRFLYQAQFKRPCHQGQSRDLNIDHLAAFGPNFDDEPNGQMSFLLKIFLWPTPPLKSAVRVPCFYFF